MLDESGSLPDDGSGIRMSDADGGVVGGVVDDTRSADGADEVQQTTGGVTSEGIGADARCESDAAPDIADDGLVSRLQLIEERPLQDRADAYGRIHGELVDALEGGDHPELDD
ncbi:hypothetical protein ACX9R5_18215 [Rathayibacter sp. CAU 1779]